jgi:hypothetical protein
LKENDLQVEKMVSGQFSAMHLRFTVRAAYDHFFSVHKVTVGVITPAAVGMPLSRTNSMDNTLSIPNAHGDGPLTPKLSPRHPRSARRRESAFTTPEVMNEAILEEDDHPNQLMTVSSAFGNNNVSVKTNLTGIHSDMSDDDDDDDGDGPVISDIE